MSEINPIPYATPVRATARRSTVLAIGLSACLLGLMANGIPAYFVLSLLEYPAGMSMRPMIEVGMVFLGGVAGTVAVLPLSVVCLARGRRWWAGWLLGIMGCVLGISPWFLNNGLLNWVVAKRGFIMEP
jgi:hypothetical protein